MTDISQVSQERLLAVLRPHLRLLPPGAPIPMDADLGRLGLDSLQSIDLLMALEQEFALTIPDEKITTDSFASPASLAALLVD